MNFSYICIECGRSYVLEPTRYLCDDCSVKQESTQPLRGQLEVRLSGNIPPQWEALKKFQGKSGEIPYADSRTLLPVKLENFPVIPVGETPLWSPERLREEWGLKELFLKDDTANPSGSLKDRASYLVAAFARANNLKKIVVASTGNAGSSMAAVAAASGLDVRLYLPAAAPQAKMVQALQYGADLQRVEGTYDDAFDQSLAYLRAQGGLSRNTAHNPLTVEGKKTVALEIFRQLKARVPDLLYVPSGDGVILSGVYKGFEDLLSLGLADRIPEIVCVQAEGSAALTRAFILGSFGKPQAAKTVADSISVDVPRGGIFALGRLKKHGGRCVTVSDQAILLAQKRLSQTTGLFAEPAAAAAFAGLLADKEAGKGPGMRDQVVLLITGNGLKDIPSALKGVEKA